MGIVKEDLIENAILAGGVVWPAVNVLSAVGCSIVNCREENVCVCECVSPMYFSCLWHTCVCIAKDVSMRF